MNTKMVSPVRLWSIGREAVWVLAIGALAIALSVGWTLRTTTFLTTDESLVAMGPDDLAGIASLVVLAEVRGQSSRVQPPSARGAAPMVLTDTALQVLETYKGSSGSSLNVTTFGGRSASIVQNNPDAASFTPGDRVILFLAPDSSGRWQVIGGFQGRYRVAGDRATNEKQSLPVADLIAVVRRHT